MVVGRRRSEPLESSLALNGGHPKMFHINNSGLNANDGEIVS